MAFPLVAIGASAGGLEAVSELLSVLPPTSDMAYVLIQHLDPDHPSLLVELLAKKTAMPVLLVHEGLMPEVGRLYVIPPNNTLTLNGDCFRLGPRPGGLFHPVDAFMVSLAHTRAETAIGVVLSGGDSDGTAGVQAIKENGGITFAQLVRALRDIRFCCAAISVPGRPERCCSDSVLWPITREAGLTYLPTKPIDPRLRGGQCPDQLTAIHLRHTKSLTASQAPPSSRPPGLTAVGG